MLQILWLQSIIESLPSTNLKQSGVFIFIPAKEELTPAIANKFWTSIYKRHTRPNGLFRDGSHIYAKEDARLHSEYKAKYYHIVKYMHFDGEASLKDQWTGPHLSTSHLKQLTGLRRVLDDRFPVGKYSCNPSLSIIDESCVFQDKRGIEIACYDRYARTEEFTKHFNKELLSMLKSCHAPNIDVKSHHHHHEQERPQSEEDT